MCVSLTRSNFFACPQRACEAWTMLDVPVIVRNKAVALGAADWLEALNDLVEAVSASWRLCIGSVC